MPLPFHPLTIADKSLVQTRVFHTDCRNCDLNFMNLVSWRFLYDTDVADCEGWLLFRFKANGHLAYLPPIGEGDITEMVKLLLEDAAKREEPFLMLGACENMLNKIQAAMPDHFHATADRGYADYIYRRESLATLAGKKLQSKRNFANRFANRYPDCEVVPITRQIIPQCIELEEKWERQKGSSDDTSRHANDAERRSLLTAFEHWEMLDGNGIALRVGGEIVAFTYGAPVNHDTFDVCVEKADISYEGAFAAVNREFARNIPARYIFVNREEDLGIEGLRKAKLSYHPETILQKYTITARSPFAQH